MTTEYKEVRKIRLTKQGYEEAFETAAIKYRIFLTQDDFEVMRSEYYDFIDFFHGTETVEHIAEAFAFVIRGYQQHKGIIQG